MNKSKDLDGVKKSYNTKVAGPSVRFGKNSKVFVRAKTLQFAWTVSTVFLVAALDITKLVSTGQPFRYAIFIPLVLFSLMSDMKSQNKTLNPLSGVTIATCLFGLWLISILILALVNGKWSSETGVYLIPGLILVAAPLIASISPSDKITSEVLRSVLPAFSMITFAAVSIYDVFGTPPQSPPYVLSHERFFLVFFALILPNFKGSKFAKLSLIAAATLSFFQYPTATASLMAIAFASYLVITNLKFIGTTKFLLLSSMVGLALWFSSDSSLRLAFYSLFGRYDNSQTRFQLWDQALKIIFESPLVGGAGSAPVTGISLNNIGQAVRIPIHNSYMSLAVASGLVSVIFLLSISLFLVWVYISKTSTSANPGGEYAAILVVLLITLTVNPVLDSLTGAIGFYTIFLISVLSIKPRVI
jgi:hypothetical protein